MGDAVGVAIVEGVGVGIGVGTAVDETEPSAKFNVSDVTPAACFISPISKWTFDTWGEHVNSSIDCSYLKIDKTFRRVVGRNPRNRNYGVSRRRLHWQNIRIAIIRP